MGPIAFATFQTENEPCSGRSYRKLTANIYNLPS